MKIQSTVDSPIELRGRSTPQACNNLASLSSVKERSLLVCHGQTFAHFYSEVFQLKGYKNWLTAGITLSIIGILTGCGNANNTTGGAALAATNTGNQAVTNSATNTATTGAVTNQTTGANSGVQSGIAVTPPQIDGTIASIQSGDPSYVTLTNVLPPSSTSRIKLPAGHFVSEDHWQSVGDTLDLFLGEGFIEMTKTGQISDVMPDQGFAGIVKSINKDSMVIQKVLYQTHGMKATGQTVHVNLAPYTKVSPNGSGSGPMGSVRVGDAVLFVLIGPPSEYIATQITDFRSPTAAGWNMQQ